MSTRLTRTGQTVCLILSSFAFLFLLRGAFVGVSSFLEEVVRVDESSMMAFGDFSKQACDRYVVLYDSFPTQVRRAFFFFLLFCKARPRNSVSCCKNAACRVLWGLNQLMW